MLDFKKFKIVTAGPVRITMYITKPYFVLIGRTFAAIWPIFDFYPRYASAGSSRNRVHRRIDITLIMFIH